MGNGTVKKVEKKTSKSKKQSEKFTLDQAVEELKKKDEARIANEQMRLREFSELVMKAEAKTGCTLKIDGSSPLNNLRIIPVPFRDEETQD